MNTSRLQTVVEHKFEHVQVFGQSLKVSMTKAWILSHHIGKEFASRVSISTPQIATRNLLVLAGL